MNITDIDVMVDVETLGVTSQAAVLSIGAVAFRISDHLILSEFEIFIDLQSALDNGNVDASTLSWWLSQEKNAQDLAFTGTISAGTAIDSFLIWYRSQKPKRVWGNGPSFDITLMERLILSRGSTIPWFPWEIRDVRTIVDIIKPLMERPKNFGGIKHSPLDDAKHQANYIMKMVNLIDERLK